MNVSKWEATIEVCMEGLDSEMFRCYGKLVCPVFQLLL